MNSELTRRQLMAFSAAAGAYVLLGCGDDEKSSSPTSTASTSTPTSTERVDCVLAPEQTEGPYYIDDDLIRRDITDGKDGVPLELRLKVLRASSCEPIEKATVEVWHCDALGNYSGVNGQGGNFLRGGQRSAQNGGTTFRTIYPGWYQGRTTHIHVKVHVGTRELHTGQLYFEDFANAAAYKQSPYDSHGPPDTTNASDGIYRQGGQESTVALTRRGNGYVGRLSLGVRA
jgi:protocatechuate 3,4-dioxygenase beta subunit